MLRVKKKELKILEPNLSFSEGIVPVKFSVGHVAMNIWLLPYGSTLTLQITSAFIPKFTSWAIVNAATYKTDTVSIFIKSLFLFLF